MDGQCLMSKNIEKGSEENNLLQHPCNQQEFNSTYQYTNVQEPGLCKKLQNRTECSVKGLVLSILPVLQWLPSYVWKQNFLGDVISGFTVAVMHIPQGMAYSSLGGVPPIVGIYMAFFPVLIYFFFSSSRHVSMGTFALVCMMASKPILLHSNPQPSLSAVNSTSIQNVALTSPYTAIQVATVICFVVGMWQLFLGIFRLGHLSVLMSEVLISGFTTGAAVLVFTSQIKHVFGLKLPPRIGALKVIYTYMDVVSMIDQTNSMSLGLSFVVIVVLLSYTTFIKPRMNCKSNVPVPMELIMVIFGTLLSVCFSLKEEFKVSVVGDIPTGLPGPKLPPLELVPELLIDGLVIAIVAFSVNISMASTFARKENYDVDANQELVASGLGNLFGSFFSCLPFSASLSRSLIQHGVGGKTQLASIVSCTLLLLVLLFIGPFFEPLPHCVLAGIILPALKGMLMQVMDFPVYWRHSPRDGLIWMVTFLSVVLLDIDIGLGVGVILSLAVIILMSQKPYIHHLGNLPGTDIYLEISSYHKALPVPDVVIIRICGGLHFANKEYVQLKVKRLLKKECKKSTESPINKLVIDMSAVVFIDPASAKGLLNLKHDLELLQVSLCLAKCPVHVYEQLKRCEFFTQFTDTHLFPFIRDAILFPLQDLNGLKEVVPS